MEKDKNIIYRILDFEINPAQRSILKNSINHKLSKKSFDMLLVLLERQGELVTKDELISEVWPNQIITDDALYKQITRLRAFFSSAGVTDTVIETIRGVGVKLIPEIEIKTSESADNNKPIKQKLNLSKLWLTVVIVVSITLFGVYLFQKVNKQESVHEKITQETQEIKKINVVIMPEQKTQDWLNIGGLDYLSDLLQQQENIQAIKPQIEWFDEDNMAGMSLRLSQAEDIDYTLIVKSIYQDDKFSGHVTLRNKDNILARDIIEATTILMLFDKMNAWANQQLRISSNLPTNDNITHTSEISNYALESYLRGVSSAKSRNFEEAAQYLQTAVNQNQSYFSAWLLLAEVQSELGQYQKALAMTETIESLKDFDQSLRGDLYNTKARILLYLNNLDEAELYLKQAMTLAINNNDMRAMIVSLSSQALIHDRKGELNEETLKIIEKQLELSKTHNPSPNLIAQLNHNLAIVTHYLHDDTSAISYINKAIEQYQHLNSETGLLSSYRVLNDIYYNSAKTGEALLVLEKAEVLIKDIDAPITVVNFYTSKARSLMQQGYRKKAMESIDILNQLSVKYANNQPKINALTLQAELRLIYHESDAAIETVNQLLAIINPNPEDYPSDAAYIFSMDMYLSARFESVELTQQKVKMYVNKYPQLKTELATELRIIEALSLSKQGYSSKSSEILYDIMNVYLSQNDILDAIYIGYEILGIQWQTDMQGYLKTLNQVQELTTFDYPILKYRAQYHAYQDDFINATILMQELKPKAREFWSIDDQLLLEKYQQQSQL